MHKFALNYDDLFEISIFFPSVLKCFEEKPFSIDKTKLQADWFAFTSLLIWKITWEISWKCAVRWLFVNFFLFEIFSCQIRNLLVASNSHGGGANTLDYNIVVSKFKLQLCYYVQFWNNAHGKGMYPLVNGTSYRLNDTTTVLLWE